MLHPQIHANFTKGKEFMLQNVGVVPLVNISEGLLPQQAGQALLAVSGETFLKNPLLHHEVFGPFSIIVECNDNDQMLEVLANLEGQLTGTIIATQQELPKPYEYCASTTAKGRQAYFQWSADWG